MIQKKNPQQDVQFLEKQAAEQQSLKDAAVGETIKVVLVISNS